LGRVPSFSAVAFAAAKSDNRGWFFDGCEEPGLLGIIANMTSTEPWTVGRLLGWTADYLKRQGADSPRLDAEVLLAEVLHCPRIQLYTSFDVEPSEAARAAFRELVRRRAEGTPVAYLVGRKEFFSLSFRVTPDVLIPRPETEFLVTALLDRAKARGPGEVSICDVGTGSGCIVVAAAKHLPRARLTAVDVSPAALEVAQSNAAAHQVGQRIEWYPSDLFERVPEDRRFDFVVSNPPYITDGQMAELSPEVRDREPHAALAGGPDGLAVIRRLVAQSADRLHPGGGLLVEVSPMIHDAATALLAADGRFDVGLSIKDLARLPRVVTAQRRGAK
jgi:release factor glutamine methyltransferase